MRCWAGRNVVFYLDGIHRHMWLGINHGILCLKPWGSSSLCLSGHVPFMLFLRGQKQHVMQFFGKRLMIKVGRWAERFGTRLDFIWVLFSHLILESIEEAHFF